MPRRLVIRAGRPALTQSLRQRAQVWSSIASALARSAAQPSGTLSFAAPDGDSAARHPETISRHFFGRKLRSQRAIHNSVAANPTPYTQLAPWRSSEYGQGKASQYENGEVGSLSAEWRRDAAEPDGGSLDRLASFGHARPLANPPQPLAGARAAAGSGPPANGTGRLPRSHSARLTSACDGGRLSPTLGAAADFGGQDSRPDHVTPQGLLQALARVGIHRHSVHEPPGQLEVVPRLFDRVRLNLHAPRASRAAAPCRGLQ